MRVYKTIEQNTNRVLWVRPQSGGYGGIGGTVYVPLTPPGSGFAKKLRMPDGNIVMAWPQAEIDKCVAEGGTILGDEFADEAVALIR